VGAGAKSKDFFKGLDPTNGGMKQKLSWIIFLGHNVVMGVHNDVMGRHNNMLGGITQFYNLY
jgi:hypothetical protein